MGHEYKQIIQFLNHRHNIDSAKYDISFLHTIIQLRLKITGCNTAASYYTLLEHSSSEFELFKNSLNVNHSVFFRNPLTFSVLEQIILPFMVVENGSSRIKELRVWSAACAIGQETYSLAMLLEEIKEIKNGQFSFRIFASDEKESNIVDARRGEYLISHLENLNIKRINRWFTRRKDIYCIDKRLKEHINFSVFDLLNDQNSCPPESIYGDFDLVICANLLFYYKPDYQKRILNKASDCLSERGLLITGDSERDILNKHGFQEVYPQSAVFRKNPL